MAGDGATTSVGRAARICRCRGSGMRGADRSLEAGGWRCGRGRPRSQRRASHEVAANTAHFGMQPVQSRSPLGRPVRVGMLGPDGDLGVPQAHMACPVGAVGMGEGAPGIRVDQVIAVVLKPAAGRFPCPGARGWGIAPAARGHAACGKPTGLFQAQAPASMRLITPSMAANSSSCLVPGPNFKMRGFVRPVTEYWIASL